MLAGAPSVKLGLSYTETDTANTAGSTSERASVSLTRNFPVGTGAGKVDMAWSADGTLTNASTTIVLSSLVKPAGTIAPTKARALVICNDADPLVASNSLVVGGAASHPWTNAINGTITIQAGGFLALSAPNLAGIDIASATNDQLLLTATGVVPYRVFILPASA